MRKEAHSTTTFIGGIDADKRALLGFVPPQNKQEIISGVGFMCSGREPSAQFWEFSVLAGLPGKTEVVHSATTKKGLHSELVMSRLERGFRVPPGGVIILSVSKNGTPTDLVDFSVVIEYGSSGGSDA